jgi:hypothetical protein
MELIQLFFVFVLAAFLGFELIRRVPSQLHTQWLSMFTLTSIPVHVNDLIFG